MYIVHENFLTINIIFPSTCHQDGSAAAGDVQRLVQGYTKPLLGLLSRLSDKTLQLRSYCEATLVYSKHSGAKYVCVVPRRRIHTVVEVGEMNFVQL